MLIVLQTLLVVAGIALILVIVLHAKTNRGFAITLSAIVIAVVLLMSGIAALMPATNT